MMKAYEFSISVDCKPGVRLPTALVSVFFKTRDIIGNPYVTASRIMYSTAT